MQIVRRFVRVKKVPVIFILIGDTVRIGCEENFGLIRFKGVKIRIRGWISEDRNHGHAWRRKNTEDMDMVVFLWTILSRNP